MVSTPLSRLLDATIKLHRHAEFPDQVVVDEQHRPFFNAVRTSLEQALATLNGIKFARLNDEDD